MRQIMFAALVALSAIALPGCANTPGAYIQRDDVMEAARRISADYAAAWNSGDMNRFGALYTADARHVTLGGDFLRGRQQIVVAHRAGRNRAGAGARMATRLEGARAITSNAIVAVMIVEYLNAASPTQSARLTMTLTRQNRTWQIAQAHASEVN